MAALIGLSACLAGESTSLAEPEPERIAVGSPLVDGSRIAPYRNRFDQRVRRPDGTEVHGRVEWTDVVEPLNFRGRRYLQRRITTYRTADGAVITDGGAVFDAATFAPRSSSEYQSEAEYWFAEFRDGGREMTGIAVRSADGGQPRLLRVTSEEGAFDPYNATFGLMLATLPLRPGLSISYPAVSDDKGAVRTQTATVTGREDFEGRSGVREVWVVDVRNQDGSAPSTYWISDRAPYVMRIRATNLLNDQPTVFTWTSLEG